MSLWSKVSGAEKDGSSQNETIADPPGPGAIEDGRSSVALASKLVMHQVSEPECWPIGFEEWVPAVMRGLMLVYPAKDWEITGSMVDRAKGVFQEEESRRAPAVLSRVDLQPCLICQGLLFWEAIGDPDRLHCTACKPPSSPRMVEDLWLVDGSGGFSCVSSEPHWQRAALEVYEKGQARQRAAGAARVAAENAGF